MSTKRVPAPDPVVRGAEVDAAEAGEAEAVVPGRPAPLADGDIVRNRQLMMGGRPAAPHLFLPGASRPPSLERPVFLDAWRNPG
jgi:hypothetical protein